MNSWSQMVGGLNRLLPKEINANRFFGDSHWLKIWSNNFCPSMGPNGGSVAMDSGLLKSITNTGSGLLRVATLQSTFGPLPVAEVWYSFSLGGGGGVAGLRGGRVRPKSLPEVSAGRIPVHDRDPEIRGIVHVDRPPVRRYRDPVAPVK